MIRESTYDKIYPLAQLLKEKSMVIKPLEGSLLDQLVKANHVDIPTIGIDKAQLDKRTLILKGSNTPDDAGVYHHDIMMEHISKTVMEIVEKNLRLARNVVNPIIKEVIEDTQGYIDHALSHIEHDIEIKLNRYDALWNDINFIEMVKRYASTSDLDVPLTVTIPLKTSEFSIPDLITTGQSTLDSYVLSILNEYPESVINTLYESVFGDPSLRHANLISAIKPNSDLKEHRDELVVLFFISKGLMNKIPDGIKVSLTEYKSYLATINSQLGKKLARMIDRRTVHQESRKLIIHYPMNQDYGNKQNEIIVNEDVYTLWLNEGGSPDVILGSWLTDQERSYTELLVKKEFFAKKWEQHEKILRMTKTKDKFNDAIEGLRKAVTKQINQIDEAYLLTAKEQYHQLLDKHISYLPQQFYNDLVHHVRNIVCKVLFSQTDALDILKAIDEVSDEFEDIKPREAALLATIQWVGVWLAKNCAVEYLTFKEE